MLALWKAFPTTALCTARTTKNECYGRLPLVQCDHVNTSSVELLVVLTDIWPEYKLYRCYCRKIKVLALRNIASPRNTNNAHITRTTTYTQNYFHRCVAPLGHGVKRIHYLVLENSTYSVLYLPKVEFMHFPGTSTSYCIPFSIRLEYLVYRYETWPVEHRIEVGLPKQLAQCSQTTRS